MLGKAETLCNLLEFDTARMHNEEALALAIELGLNGLILQSHILAAKIDFVCGSQDNARQQLAKLLAETNYRLEREGALLSRHIGVKDY